MHHDDALQVSLRPKKMHLILQLLSLNHYRAFFVQMNFVLFNIIMELRRI